MYQGCIMANYFPTHLNVPIKQWSGVSSTNCEDQENRHPQPTTLITQVNQHCNQPQQHHNNISILSQ
jgi:hypothetical protein